MALADKPVFSRASVAYKKDGSQVAINQPRYEVGKFRQGITIEEGTTNQVTNSSMVVSSDGILPTNWAKLIVSGAATATWEEGGFQGKCLRVYSANTIDRALWSNTTLTSSKASQPYTLSGWVDTPSLAAGHLRIQETLSGSLYNVRVANYTGNTKIDSTGGIWYELAVTFTTSSIFTGWTWGIRVDSNYKAVNLKICDIQLEEKSYPTSYFRNDSISIGGTRQPEVFVFSPIGVVSEQEGTIELKCRFIETLKYQLLFSTNTTISSLRSFYTTLLGGKIVFTVGTGITTMNVSSPNTLSPNVWYDITFVWNQTGIYLYMDGIKVSELVTAISPLHTQAKFGYASDLYTSSVILDDFRISSIARSSESILKSHNSNLPLPVDEYTTFKLDFENSLEQTWLYLGRDWLPSDKYNADDLNKVNSNIQRLRDNLRSIGCNIADTPVMKVNFTRLDFPKVSDINATRTAINNLIQGFYSVSAPPVAVNLARLQIFSYVEANALELNVQALYDMYNTILASLKYSGTFYSGQEIKI